MSGAAGSRPGPQSPKRAACSGKGTCVNCWMRKGGAEQCPMTGRQHRALEGALKRRTQPHSNPGCGRASHLSGSGMPMLSNDR